MDVLVVEDDADIAEALQDLLVADGLSVTLAANGLLALEYLESFVPDVILLDLMMPVMDGFELLRRLKGTPSAAVPVILTSAITDGPLPGTVAAVRKPYDVDALLALIRRTVLAPS